MIGLYRVQDKRLNTINDNIVHFLIFIKSSILFIHLPIYRVFVEKRKIIQQVILENKTNSIIMIRKYGEAYFSIYK